MFATSFALVALMILLYRILSQGLGYFDFDFLTNFASRIPENAGIKAALVGSLWLMTVVAPVSTLLGVSTAIYLEEYAKQNKLNDFIRMNISNLAGVPSIVFSLLAQGLNPFDSAILATFFNGTAGDLAMEDLGYGYGCEDLIKYLSVLMQDLI